MVAGSNPRVLVVAPGKKGRGGIASVVQMHQRTETWTAMSCRLLSTFNDRSVSTKLLAAALGYLRAPFALLRSQILHVHAAGETSLLRKLPIIVLAKALRRSVILHIHASSESSLFVKTPRWAWWYALNAADCTITLSPRWAQMVKNHVPKARVVVVPNPVKTYRSTRRVPHPAPRVLYVGKVEQRKGYDTLLQAAATVHRDHPSVEFWFAGHGEVDQARALSDRLGLSPVVRYLGWVGPAELEEIFEQVDLFCLPSRNEGVPMAMLEAMSHALPIVVTPVGGIPDVVHDGYNGLLVPPDDAVALATALSRLLADAAYADRLGEEARKTVKETCNLEKIGDQLAAIYRSSLRGARVVASGAQ